MSIATGEPRLAYHKVAFSSERPLTFSLSHDAQPCFCEEPNCVGSIGGKTQTDVGGMDDLYLDGKRVSLLSP